MKLVSVVIIVPSHGKEAYGSCLRVGPMVGLLDLFNSCALFLLHPFNIPTALLPGFCFFASHTQVLGTVRVSHFLCIEQRQNNLKLGL